MADHLYIVANIGDRTVRLMEHEGDYEVDDVLLRISITNHESIATEVKPVTEANI